MLLVALLSVVLVAVLGALAVVRFAVARAQLSAAADLAALAAADERNCGLARSSAVANRAAVVSCVVDGADVEVVLGREVELGLGRSVRLSAWARAGPP